MTATMLKRKGGLVGAGATQTGTIWSFHKLVSKRTSLESIFEWLFINALPSQGAIHRRALRFAILSLNCAVKSSSDSSSA
jgi:hypothetical protein